MGRKDGAPRRREIQVDARGDAERVAKVPHPLAQFGSQPRPRGESAFQGNYERVLPVVHAGECRLSVDVPSLLPRQPR